MAKKSGLPVMPLIIIVIGIIVVLYILKNKNLFRFGAPATAGAAIGATVQGSNVYPVVAQITPPGSYGLFNN